MGTVRLLVGAGLRARWRPLAGLALMLGVLAGVVLIAAAGARRTESAYPRLLTWANATQVSVVVTQSDAVSAAVGRSRQAYLDAGGPAEERTRQRFFTALGRLPGVASVTRATQYNMALPGPGGQPDPQVQVFASPDGTLGVTGDRVKLVSGRMFGAHEKGQAVIDPGLAARRRLRPGDTLRLIALPKTPDGAASTAKAYPLTVTVAGIAVFDDKVVPATTTAQPRVLLSPPFAATYAALTMTNLPEADIRLRPGASMTAFLHEADALRARMGVSHRSYLTITTAEQVAATQRAIRPQAIALAAFAALAGLIGLAVTGQLLARQLALDARDFPVLRAAGMTRGQLAAVSLAQLATATLSGAGVAVVAALAASPLMPIGPARTAEPAPGLAADPVVLGTGFAAIVLLPLAVVAPTAWHLARRADGRPGAARPAGRPSALATALGRAGPVTGAIGARMAFEPGRGRTAVPVRSAVAGTTVAVAAVVAAVIFGISLIGLVSTPARYGQNWDQQLDLHYADVPLALGAQAAAVGGVTGYAAGNQGELSIGGTSVPAIGIDPVRGGGYLTLQAGRAPAGPDEIAVGARTLRALHKRIGQTVVVRVTMTAGQPGPAVPRPMRITGTAVLPSFGLPALPNTDLGTGAVVAPSLLSAPMPATGCTTGMTCYSFFLLRHAPGTDLAASATRLLRFTDAHGCGIGECVTASDQRPGDIRNFTGIRDTPLALAAVLAVLAGGTLTHVLVTSVRRRRRDLAVLKTLGFTRAQVLRAVAWQATALAAAALVAGVPAGVVAGRWAWALFANAAGVSATPTITLPFVLAVVSGTVLTANLIAAWPGWTAARSRPAVVLRTE